MIRRGYFRLRGGISGLVLASVVACSIGDARAGGIKWIDTISKEAEGMRAELVATRRDIHEHPELSNREVRTSALVVARLKELGFDEIRTNEAGHGVVALLKGGKPGAVVAVRADMDALPIGEVHSVPYKSTVEGVMHACGHDAHTTIELGVAEILSKMRGEIPGIVKFIFQPDEEGAPGETGGAAVMIKEGALEHPKPSAIFGLHVSPELEVGAIGYRAGAAQAAAENIDFIIHGKMGHAAHPDRGVDAIVVAAECVNALQTIKSRRIDTFEPMILTIGTIQGGTKRNIMTDEVKMEGTLRTLDEKVRKRAEELIRQTLDGITRAYGATYELKMSSITAQVYNDPKLTEETLPTMRRVDGAENVVEVPPRMGAEDFSYYEEVVPGFLFRLGCGNKAAGITSDIHTPDFDIDEDCLVVGVNTMSHVLIDYLERHSQKK